MDGCVGGKGDGDERKRRVRSYEFAMTINELPLMVLHSTVLGVVPFLLVFVDNLGFTLATVK